MALAAVGGGHARDEQRRAAERQRDVRAVERRHPAVAEPRARADDPGPGPDDRGVPAERRDAVMERARRADRLQLAAVGRAGRDVPGEQPGPAQGGDRRGSARPGSAPPSVCT